MSEPDAEPPEVLRRWTAGSLALFVIGLEVLLLGVLIVGRMGPGLLPYGGTAMVVGAGLIVVGLMIKRGRRAVPTPRWTEGSVASFVFGLLIIVPSGLCTSWGGLYALSTMGAERPSTQRAIESAFIMTQVVSQVLIIGGISMAIGVAFVLAGLKTRRRD